MEPPGKPAPEGDKNTPLSQFASASGESSCIVLQDFPRLGVAPDSRLTYGSIAIILCIPVYVNTTYCGKRVENQNGALGAMQNPQGLQAFSTPFPQGFPQINFFLLAYSTAGSLPFHLPRLVSTPGFRSGKTELSGNIVLFILPHSTGFPHLPAFPFRLLQSTFALSHIVGKLESFKRCGRLHRWKHKGYRIVKFHIMVVSFLLPSCFDVRVLSCKKHLT